MKHSLKIRELRRHYLNLIQDARLFIEASGSTCVSHTFSRKSSTLLHGIHRQDSKESVELTPPRYPDDEDRVRERASVPRKCEKSGSAGISRTLSPPNLLPQRNDNVSNLHPTLSAAETPIESQLSNTGESAKFASQREKEVRHCAWELHPPPQSEEDPHLLVKISPFVSTCELNTAVFLFLPKENGAHRLFLENVCRAITKSFAPASVVLYHEKLILPSSNKIFLGPLSLLRKQFSGLEIHQINKQMSFSIIALEEIDIYIDNVNAKRALWKTIQRLFQS